MVCTQRAEANVVVAVVRVVVVVAIGGAEVDWVVVPAAAPINPVGALVPFIPVPYVEQTYVRS